MLSLFSNFPPLHRLPGISSKSPGYEIHYLYIIITAYYIIFTTISLDVLFFHFALNIQQHLKILQKQFRNGKVLNKESLKRSIHYHQNIIEASNILSRIFKPIIFMQSSLTSLMMCTMAYQIVQLTEASNLFGLVSFLFSMCLQLLVYCYVGEQICSEVIIVYCVLQNVSFFPWIFTELQNTSFN